MSTAGGIGKFTGTPTANLAPALETVLPENGVYISKILLDTQTYYGATHIGTRPTVDGNPDISVENDSSGFSQRNLRLQNRAAAVS